MFRHVPDIPSINSCIYYIGPCCTTFPFQIENERFGSISYLYGGCRKVWSVFPVVDKTRIEHLLPSKMFNLNYVKDHKGDIAQFLEIKILMCNSYFLKHEDPKIKMMNILQPYRQFVTLSPGTYHDDFSTGCNIAKDINFADFLWYDVGRLTH